MKSNHGGKVFELARKLSIPVESVVDFSANINPLGPPKGWKEILTSNMDQLIHYPDSGYEEYRMSVANRYKIDKSHVVAGNGVADLIWLYARTVRPRKVVLVSPTFGEYESAFRPWCKEIVHVISNALSNFEPNLQEIETALVDAELLILCNPNNPTGTIVTSSTMDRLIEFTFDRGIKFMIDESFIEFVTTGISVLERPLKANLFVLRSQTKIGAVPGLRVGFAVCSDSDLIDKLRIHGDSWPMNSLAAAFGSFLVDQTSYIEQSQHESDRLRVKLIESLLNTGVLAPFPSTVNFILCRILGSITADQLCEKAMNQGVLIRNAKSFVGLNNRFVRIAVRPEHEQERLISFLRNL